MCGFGSYRELNAATQRGTVDGEAHWDDRLTGEQLAQRKRMQESALSEVLGFHSEDLRELLDEWMPTERPSFCNKRRREPIFDELRTQSDSDPLDEREFQVFSRHRGKPPESTPVIIVRRHRRLRASDARHDSTIRIADAGALLALKSPNSKDTGGND